VSDYLNYVPAKNVKNINKHAALDLIRFTPGGISRVKLAKRMDLSRAALTLIINDLLASGVICETSSTLASAGRPPITLAVNPERGTVAGLDMGATHLNLIIANGAAQPLAEKEIALDINQGPAYCLEQAELHLRELVSSAGLAMTDLLAVGLGVPGHDRGRHGHRAAHHAWLGPLPYPLDPGKAAGLPGLAQQ
jgi:hypothetical protein